MQFTEEDLNKVYDRGVVHGRRYTRINWIAGISLLLAIILFLLSVTSTPICVG